MLSAEQVAEMIGFSCAYASAMIRITAFGFCPAHVDSQQKSTNEVDSSFRPTTSLTVSISSADI
jgi:hypothetical protein